jgi:predicted transposase/invertase (TIGR01784 family)
VDVKAKSLNGKLFNIEMQIAHEADYNKRALYYWAKLYTQQLKESEDYANLSKAIGIHILNFTCIPESDKYHNVFHIVEKEKKIPYFQDLELHTIELRKFTDKVNNELPVLLRKIKTSLDSWVAFLTKYNLLDKDNLPTQLKGQGDLKKALNILEIMNFNETEREEYENHLKWLQIQNNTLRNIEQKAEQRGRQIGQQIGEERGEQRGEQNALRKVAINLLKQGLSIEQIMQGTDLSHSEIKAIQDTLVHDDSHADFVS